MANHSSSRRAIRQTLKRTLINKSRLSRVRTYIKRVINETVNGSKESAKSAFIIAQSQIMKGVTKNIFTLNTASRKISRLAARIKKM